MAFGNKNKKAEIAKSEHQELMEKIDSMQKFLEEYTKITLEMQACVEKSIKFQSEMIDFFGNEIKAIKEREQYYIEVATTAKAEAEATAEEMAATPAIEQDADVEAAVPEAVLTEETAAEEVETATEEIITEEVAEAVESSEENEEVTAESVDEDTAYSVSEETAVEETTVEADTAAESLEENVSAEPAEEPVTEEPAAVEPVVEPVPVVEQAALPKMNQKEKKGLFGGLFKRKKKDVKVDDAAKAPVEVSAEEMAAKKAEEEAFEDLKAANTVELTPEEEKRLARLSAAPSPYVGSPVKSYPRDGEKVEEKAVEVEETKTIDEILNPEFEHIDIPESEPTKEEIDEAVLAENEAIVDAYASKQNDLADDSEINQTTETEEIAEEYTEVVEEETVSEEVAEAESDIDALIKAAEQEAEESFEDKVESSEETIEAEIATEETVEVATEETVEETEEIEPEADDSAETVAETVVEAVVANPIYNTEEGQRMISELKADHEKEAAATDRLVDNMYKRHREELMRLCDELNVDYGEFDGYSENMNFPEGDAFEELKSLVTAHINEKKTISGLKERMVARHQDEDKELCKEIGLAYEDYVSGNY